MTRLKRNKNKNSLISISLFVLIKIIYYFIAKNILSFLYKELVNLQS